ncbi:MAG TPA: LysE family transporter [Desulfosalsimonadaceae bacterium]|nr:LysE family transporter [Desulfosalsimonadaceae bacterium]
MIHFLVIGIILGLPAGLTPGPLLALVISETLQHNMQSGIKVAIVPLLTDIPIILLTLLILAELSGFHHILGIISLTGGCVVLFMGWQGLRSEGFVRDTAAEAPASLTKGILANVLNPHPYLFWIAVGAPIMHKAMAVNIFALMAFIGTFYTMLVGAKIVLAVLVGKSKLFLSSSVYGYTLRFLGLVLCVFSLFLFHEGFKLLGLI